MRRSRHEPAFGAVEHRYGRGHKRVRAWDVSGDPGTDDLTFVLVHGLGVSSDLFRPVVDRLRHLGRVVVFDLPGFGGVPHPRDPMDIPAFARAIAPGLDRLGVTEPVLVGHSMGSQVVVELARREPHLRGRMVLVAPVVSEKATMVSEKSNVVTFKVLQGATKPEIKAAVELLFKVEVTGVSVVNVKGKTKRFGKTTGRRDNVRKAYVQLKEGQDLNLSGEAA